MLEDLQISDLKEAEVLRLTIIVDKFLELSEMQSISDHHQKSSISETLSRAKLSSLYLLAKASSIRLDSTINESLSDEHERKIFF